MLYIIKSVTLAAPFQTAFYIDFKPAAAVIAPAVKPSATLRRCKHERTHYDRISRSLAPSNRAQAASDCALLEKCDVEALFGLPSSTSFSKPPKSTAKTSNPREIQLSTLLSIKTGGCPEDCAYCPQSAHHNTNLGKEQMMDVDEIVEKAKIAQSRGASRFCMGAAWRGPKPKDVAVVSEIISAVKGLGMEVCGTFGHARRRHG